METKLVNRAFYDADGTLLRDGYVSGGVQADLILQPRIKLSGRRGCARRDVARSHPLRGCAVAGLVAVG